MFTNLGITSILSQKYFKKCTAQMRAKTLHGFEVKKYDCSLKYRLFH